MSDNLTVPFATGTIIATKEIAGVHHPKNLLTDHSGADVIGLVAATPAPNTLLGRVKDIADAIIARLPTLGAKAASGSVSVTPSSDGFAITAGALPLPAGAATEATLGAVNAKLPATLGAKAAAGSLSVVPSSEGFAVSVPGGVAVTGSFYQATQPVSAAALPLPAGAATETTIAAVNGKLPALGPKAASGSVSVAPSSDGFAITAASLPLPTGAATATGQAASATALSAVQAATEAAQPATQAFAITAHDTNAITPLPRAVRINSAGTVTFRLSGSTADVTITALAGEVIPGRVQYIRATGTTATGLLGLA